MSASCGQNGPIEGGIISSSTIVGSTVQGSIISGSAIQASSLEQLTKVDDSSALVIADAISKLSTEQLRALAKAIADAMPLLSPTVGPASTNATSLPTEVVGSREKLLGGPSGWLKLRGVVVPAYASQE